MTRAYRLCYTTISGMVMVGELKIKAKAQSSCGLGLCLRLENFSLVKIYCQNKEAAI